MFRAITISARTVRSTRAGATAVRMSLEAKNRLCKPITGVRFCVAKPSRDDFPLAFLDWEDRDHGREFDADWWLLYYCAKDLAPYCRIGTTVLFDLSPRALLGSYWVYASAAGLSPDGQWVSSSWKKIQIEIEQGRNSVKPAGRSHTLWKAMAKVFPVTSLPKNWIRSEFSPLLPPQPHDVRKYPLTSVQGFVEGARAVYEAGDNNRRVVLNIYRFEDEKGSSEFECFLWGNLWSEHRYLEDFGEIQMCGLKMTRLKTKDGAVLVGRNGNLAFSIYFLRWSEETRPSKQFIRRFIELLSPNVMSSQPSHEA